jgi:8-oxo-dGTP pyrophosphatase MutT (NUDIX family)
MQLFVGTKALICHKGKILLLRESREYIDGAEQGKWDVPGGRIDPSETLEEGLLREVAEETGLKITMGKLLAAFDGFPVIREEKCHVVRLYFLCQAHSDAVTLSTDHDAYEWVDPKHIGEKILMNDIEEMLQAVSQNL